MQLLVVLFLVSLCWIVGWMFTIGRCLGVGEKPKTFWQALEVLLLWPLILGCFYRVKNEGSENDE